MKCSSCVGDGGGGGRCRRDVHGGRSLARSYCSELLWLISQSRFAVSKAHGQFGNREEGEGPTFETVTSRLVKREEAEKNQELML
jgi:hypothetical protein